MITFKEFIAEDLTQLSPMIKLIRRDCKPFLDAVDGQPMYRGIKVSVHSESVKGMGPYMVKGTVRKNRQPKDSSVSLHRILDTGFKKEFGLPGRSAALFAVFNESTAGGYGSDNFMIFPKGDVKFLWSPYITDAYDAFEQSWGEFGHDANQKQLAEWLEQGKDELGFTANLTDLDPQDRLDVTEWLVDHYMDKLYTMQIVPKMEMHFPNYEIMVFCDSFYGIKLDALDKEFDVSPRDLMKEIGK